VDAEEVAPIPLLNPVAECGSTWRAVKREHGISVSSAVTSFEYEGLAFNLLDTLGHQDFSEVIHRAPPRPQLREVSAERGSEHREWAIIWYKSSYAS
jgi:hypothetical protein